MKESAHVAGEPSTRDVPAARKVKASDIVRNWTEPSSVHPRRQRRLSAAR